MLKHKAKTPKSEPVPPKVDGAVVSESFAKASIFTKKRIVLLAGFVAVVLLVVVAVVLLNGRDNKKEDTEDPSYTVSDEQYAKGYAKALEEKLPPPEGSSDREVAVYYSELITTYFTAKNYQATVDSYDKYVQESGDKDFLFSGYNAAANAYLRLGKKSEASKVVERAEVAVQRTVSDKELLAEYMTLLSTLKQEANK